MNVELYSSWHWNIFSLGFGLGKIGDNTFDVSLALFFLTVGIQFIKTPKASDLLKELEDK